VSRKREHSRKPDQLYEIIEQCSPGPYLELFARTARPGWKAWGDESESYQPPDNLYARQSQEIGWRLFEKGFSTEEAAERE
jgi:N6-adenosine-specific RNA methylase IME4